MFRNLFSYFTSSEMTIRPLRPFGPEHIVRLSLVHVPTAPHSPTSSPCFPTAKTTNTAMLSPSSPTADVSVEVTSLFGMAFLPTYSKRRRGLLNLWMMQRDC